MSKTSVTPANDFCPQTLFLYGTYDDQGKPDFGLFCWFSYIWDGELGVMCCIGGEKQTKENWIENHPDWQYLRNDRFIIPEDVTEIEIKVRKIYKFVVA